MIIKIILILYIAYKLLELCVLFSIKDSDLLEIIKGRIQFICDSLYIPYYIPDISVVRVGYILIDILIIISISYLYK